MPETRLEWTLALLHAATALRPEESFGLKWEDLDWKKGQINLRRGWSKGRETRGKTRASMTQVQAQMLSYSRAKGVFGGLSLSGTSLGPDEGDNEKLYGKKVSGTEIYGGSVNEPASADGLLAELEKASPKNLAKGK